MSLVRSRGVRDTYILEATSELAEVNPVLRHHLHELYQIELPEFVDLRRTDLKTLHAAVNAEITRSEPGIALHLITRPQIRLATERARRRLDAWRRRSSASGKGLARHQEVSFSYAMGNFQPLGRQLYEQLVKPEDLAVEVHLLDALPAPPPSVGDPASADAEAEPGVVETQRKVWAHVEDSGGPMDWAVDLSHCTLGNFNYRKMSLVRDYGRMLDETAGHDHPAFDALFSTEARVIATPPVAGGDPFEPFAVIPADPTQTAAILWARSGRDFIIQGPPGTGKSQTITNLIADFAARGKRVLFVCQKRAALDVVYHRLAEHGLDELSVLIHDSQADKKPFLDELNATYTSWSNVAESAPDGRAEERRSAVIRRLREPLGALSSFSAGMTSHAVGASTSLFGVIEECVTGAAIPALEAASSEQVPAHAHWRTHRDTVHAAARALLDLGASPILSELALRHVGRAVLDAPHPGQALRLGLDRLEAMLTSLGGVATALGSDAGAAELSDALAVASAVEPLAAVNQLSLLDAGSSSARTLSGFATSARVATRKLDALRQETVGWREKLSRGDVGTALEQARGFDLLFVVFRWLSPAWWRMRAMLRTRYDFARHAIAPAWTPILAALAAERDQELVVANIEADAGAALGFDGPLSDLIALVDRLRANDGRTALQVALRDRFVADSGLVRALLGARTTIEALGREADAVFDGGGTWPIAELAVRVAEARAAAPMLAWFATDRSASSPPATPVRSCTTSSRSG